MKKTLVLVLMLLTAIAFISCKDESGSEDSTSDSGSSSTQPMISSFSFNATENSNLSADVTASIDETDNTITASVPYGTDKTALVATFTTTASSISLGTDLQSSGVTSNDFTNSLTYTLTLDNDSTDDSTSVTRDYAVTVTTTASTASITVSKTSLVTSESGGTDSFSVVLDTLPDGDVVFDLSNGDTTEASTDKSTLTFTASNYSVAQTVTVAGLDDSLLDGNQVFDFTLTINTSSTTDTTGYAGLSSQTISVTNSDDDTAGFTFIGGSVTTIENGADQTVDVRPNTQPAVGKTITVAISSADTTEGDVSPDTLSWTDADWTTAKTITITPVDDSLIDNAIVYNIELDPATSTESSYSSLSVETVSVTNTDDEPIDNSNGTVTLAGSNLTWMKCSQGQGQLDCSGSATPLQYCNAPDNTCNGGTNAGVLDGGGTSAAWNSCDSLKTGSFTGRTGWRVPTYSELSSFYSILLANTSIFSNGATTTYYLSASGGSAAHTFKGVFSSNGALANLTKNSSYGTRCVTTGL